MGSINHPMGVGVGPPPSQPPEVPAQVQALSQLSQSQQPASREAATEQAEVLSHNTPEVQPAPALPPHTPAVQPVQSQEVQHSSSAVRRFRRYRVYTRFQKDRAVRLLNAGISCRHVARLIGCSSGAPIRWRNIALRQAEARRRLQEIMRHFHRGH